MPRVIVQIETVTERRITEGSKLGVPTVANSYTGLVYYDSRVCHVVHVSRVGHVSHASHFQWPAKPGMTIIPVMILMSEMKLTLFGQPYQ